VKITVRASFLINIIVPELEFSIFLDFCVKFATTGSNN
jgi:hypothetical protein